MSNLTEDERLRRSVDEFLEHVQTHGLMTEEQIMAETTINPWDACTQYGRADLMLHPLIREAYKVACLIEACGASPELTAASCAAFCSMWTPRYGCETGSTGCCHERRSDHR